VPVQMKLPNNAPQSALQPIETDQMWCYSWFDRDRPKLVKFGERYVYAGQTPWEEIRNRVRAQQQTSKYRFDQGDIVIPAIWNVTPYAIRIGRMFKQARVDDVLRQAIGNRVGSTGEFHEINSDKLIERVNKELGKDPANLPVVGLSTLQYQMAGETLDAFDLGHRVIMAELCARFGKTIWAGSVAVEMDSPVTVIASYVLTSFSSFIKDLTSFNQFAHLVHIDTKLPDWVERRDLALAQGQRVVLYLSMCGASSKTGDDEDELIEEGAEFISKRDERIKNIWSNSENRKPILLIIDEADFGIHTEAQARPLINAQSSQDRVILMTGTNADRASSLWSVDYYQNVVYPELLMMKARAKGEKI